MNDSNLTRRRMVGAIIAFSGAAAMGLDSRWSLASRAWAESTGQSGAGVTAAMLRMARLLYPHDALSDAVYSGVLDRSLSAVAAGTEFRNQLDQAATALDARAGRPWLELDPAAQLCVMRDIEQEAFFVAIQEAVRTGIYNDPTFWKHIGYGGPSKGLGGYLHRGAGDIDWLPRKLS
jgi:hypothetical protein